MYYSNNETRFLDHSVDDEWREILEEDQIPLEELYPEEFERYKHLFFNFWSKSPYHAKREYTSGFIAPKQKIRKDGHYYNPSAFEDMVARHLDHQRWIKAKQRNIIDDSNYYWLGLRFGKKTSIKCLDVDNKHNVLGFYHTCMVQSDPARPLTVLTLERAHTIKQLYDNFPNHIWCVSSATMGLHLWEKLPYLQEHDEIERKNRYRLTKIGLGNTEVFPSDNTKNQVLRRPFGQDYYTITEDGLLSDWIDQLNYFEAKNRTPRLITILNCLADLTIREWRRFENNNGLMLSGGKLLNNWVAPANLSRFMSSPDFIDINEVRKELFRVKNWIAEGFPEINEQELTPEDNNTSLSSVLISVIKEPPSEVKSGDNRNWIQNCVNWATNGLPEDDSLFPVISALARWFYFVEYYDSPVETRLNKTIEVLQHYAMHKHNGFITTLNNGMPDKVLSRVSWIVKKAVSTSTNQDVFKDIREKRNQGIYKKGNYHLESVVYGNKDISLPSVYKSVIKDADDSLLPKAIEARLLKITKQQKMRKRNGEYPFIRFARRLLNALWASGGEARINHATVNTFMGRKPEYRDWNQPLKYKQLLASYNLIHGDWEKFIRRGEHSSLYRMKKPVRKVFELHHRDVKDT